MSYHPDPAIDETLERNARAVTREIVAPPAEIADDPAAYIRWLREQRPQLPPRPSVSRFTGRNDQARGPVPARRMPVQEGQPSNPLAWAPTPEDVEQLDGVGAARYTAATFAQNDSRNQQLAALARQAVPASRRTVPAPRRSTPKTEQELEEERARQMAALQKLIDQQHKEGSA